MNTPLVSQTISNQPATVEPPHITPSGPKTGSEHKGGLVRSREKKPLWRPWWKQETSDLQYDRDTNTLRAKNAQGKKWKEKDERYAHAYELARRHDRSNELPAYSSSAGKNLTGIFPFWSEPDDSRATRSRELPIQEDLSIWDDENWGSLEPVMNFGREKAVQGHRDVGTSLGWRNDETVIPAT